MKEETQSKSELLHQLKIDRSKPQQPKGLSFLSTSIIAALCVAVGWYGGQSGIIGKSSQIPADNTTPQTSTPPNTAAAKNSKPKNQETEQPSPRLSQPKHSPDQFALNGSGYIVARRMATVSAEIMGLINEVSVEEGMVVQQGMVLAQLDSAIAELNLKLASSQLTALKASLKSIQASLKEAEKNYQRVTNNQFSSEAELTQTESELSRQRANLARAQADIDTQQLEVLRQKEYLDNHTIKAPFSGVVTVKNAQPGEIVAPSSAGGGFTRTGICTIVDMGSLEIEVDVNESYIGRVFVGQKVEAQLDAYNNWIIPASVIAIIPTADRAKATVKVRIKITTLDSRILPDMGVKVAFLKK